MSIGSFPGDQVPDVREYEGQILIWSGDHNDANGVLFSARAGLDVGLNCLNIASKLLKNPITPLKTELRIEDAKNPTEDIAGRLLINIEDAPFEVVLTGTQICEFAATFNAMAKNLD
ncbi:hypothetical protein [Aurantiacibacter xanthus]|uniref:hypothetical protein n=1 Tax=Aurantiacibacter xanthus TaxID=1784712 RepID=UPI0011C23D88|nr:hypothetical protein [Aurantiacibacter xanthus]